MDILLIKELPQNFDNILKVESTSDIKLLSILDKNNTVLISLVKIISNVVSLENIKSFAWQEDNDFVNEYRLLAIDKHNEICYYIIKVKAISEENDILEVQCVSKWNLKTTFKQFHDLAKSLTDFLDYEILKFEAKEAVFLFDKKIVVSYFLSPTSEPQIMSICDLSDGEISHKKVLLMKEMLFALDISGTKFSIYSFTNNTKIYEIGLSDYSFKHKDDTIFKSFSINLKMDMIVFVTTKQRLYSMSLNLCHITGNASPTVPSIITAFTKQYPSVRRLDDNLRRYSISSGSVQPIIFTCDTSDFILKELFIIENKLFFLYQGENKSLVGIHLLNSDEVTTYKVLQHNVFFLYTAPEEVTFPLLLFFNNKISLIVYNIEQDKLVNELMIYPSSGTVEILSFLNNWNSIQMDIEVLRLGLRNRKIYTVEFYLKTLFEGFCQQWNGQSSHKWNEKMHKECNNWESIINLVLQNVNKNLAESITCQYAEQLLQIIIVMVIQILDVIEEKVCDDNFFLKSEKDLILSKFSKLLLQMRKLLREQDTSSSEIFDNKNQLLPKISNYWQKWEGVSPEDIIQESLLNGTVAFAQSYFHSCKDDSNASFQQFISTSENLVLSFVRQGLMIQALSILSNMGIDINFKLLEIFKSTPERDIRMHIVNELQSRNLLDESDMELFQFVSLLEKLYPCTSFDHAFMLLNEESMASKNDMICASPFNDETLTVGDFMPFNQSNSESGAYCRIILNWLTMWNNDIKSRILAPLILKNSPVLDFFGKGGANIDINPLFMWCYLLENGKLSYLNNWIDTWLSSHETLDNSSLFKNWPINEVMINTIPKRATLYVSEMLLNKLARHGIFIEEEREDTSLLLTRIGHSQCDINDIEVFSSEKASLSFSDLMHCLVHYCLKHELTHFLFNLLSQNYIKFSVWPSCNLCDVPCLNLTKSFYLWSRNNDDSELAYDALAGLAQYLYNLKNSTPAELLQNLPLPLCLSIFLFKSEPLSDIFNQAIESPEVKEQDVKEKLLPYPVLYNYLLKCSSERNQPDVSVYELLKGSTKFDTSQLFGWQAANNLKSEDSVNEFPHFSLQSLSEQYGLKKELNYTYYLMQGRPNYAYLKFIQQEVVLETGLSVTRIKSTCSDVTDYCLANYRSTEISMACILFIELLGQDSLPLRACLVAANILHENRIFEGEQEFNKSLNEIWKKFKLAHASKDSATELISELEKIIVKNWNPYYDLSDSLVKDICLWMPLMTLCHLFEVQAGNTYLIECAKQDKWLKFLVFSQIFQISKDQVLKAASKFSNPCIYYHIFHALHKKPLLQDIFQEIKSSSTIKAPVKDMRKHLYSRIGLTKDQPTTSSKKSADDNDDQISISSEETCSSDADISSFLMKDLFSQLLLAHNSDCPWESLLHTSFEIQNPILSILAASYPQSCLQSCFFIWLYTTLSHDEYTKKQIENSCFPNQITAISTDNIENIIVLTIENKKILILWQAIQFFLPSTPLIYLMEFLKDFLVYKKFEASIENFQNHMWDYPRNCNHPSVIHSALWIENISVTILKEAVISCTTNYERVIMLRHFSHTRLEKSFSKEVIVPPFMKVCQMLQYTSNISELVDVQKLFLPEHNISYQNMCWAIVRKLLQLHQYNDAEMFATVGRLQMEDLFLLQMKQAIDEARENINWSNLSHRITFWKPILDKLSSTIIPIHAAVDFLLNQCEISDMYGEKYFLVKFVISLLTIVNYKSDMKSYNLKTLQKKMWWWCIKAEVRKELLPEIFDITPSQEFDFEDFSYDVLNSVCIIEDEQEREALGCIINQFLRNKYVKKAFELAVIFGYKSDELEIIYTCLQLAREELDVNSLNINIPDCNIEISSSRFIQSLMLWLSSCCHDRLSAKKDIIQCIEKLGRKKEVAIFTCQQILVHYIVAIILNKSFVDIAREVETLNILKQILIKKLKDEYIIAKSFIIVRNLPDRDVAAFLSEEIHHSLQVLCLFDIVLTPEEQLAFSEELIYDPLCTKESFQLIVKLLQDPSLLGSMLMNIFCRETSELCTKSSDKTFSSAVELCICAHECFIAAFNMDGISQVLHNSQVLVTLLEEAKKFSIMVRLLVGLGRYSEMLYVFDVLKSHDKLSLLFYEKMEKSANLKLALLDYLKKLPPSEADNHFYNLAKTFGMYREKAEILEMSVQKQLSQICKKNLAIGLKEELENSMQCLSEAAKSYCKADCLHQAQNCTRLAKLVALQIYFLPSGIWILGLDDASVSRFITEHDNFSQSFIVAEQYGKQQLWNQAIMNNFICRGDKEYLQDFGAQFGFSESLISDVVKRYQNMSQKSESTTRNMKYLLNLCSNIKVKYSSALELGFKDITSELLMGEGASYLQDLIANNLIK